MLGDHSGNMCDSVPIAYELQARFGTGIEWITLAIRGTAAGVETAGLCGRDPWGRTPTEVRVVPVHTRRRDP
jgi:hypothetical protein